MAIVLDDPSSRSAMLAAPLFPNIPRRMSYEVSRHVASQSVKRPVASKELVRRAPLRE